MQSNGNSPSLQGVTQRGFAHVRAGPGAALTAPRAVIHSRAPRIPLFEYQKNSTAKAVLFFW